MSLPLLPSQRIRKERDFQRIFSKGKFRKGIFFHVWVCQSPEEKEIQKPRLGVIVSRETDPRAPKRNLWKRRIREAFRELQIKLKGNTEILIKSRRCDKIPSYQEMKQELETLFFEARVLK
mgnify:CR=1 FL=1